MKNRAGAQIRRGVTHRHEFACLRRNADAARSRAGAGVRTEDRDLLWQPERRRRGCVSLHRRESRQHRRNDHSACAGQHADDGAVAGILGGGHICVRRGTQKFGDTQRAESPATHPGPTNIASGFSMSAIYRCLPTSPSSSLTIELIGPRTEPAGSPHFRYVSAPRA